MAIGFKFGCPQQYRRVNDIFANALCILRGGKSLYALLQAGLDKIVEVAIHNPFDVADLKVGA